MATSRGTDTTAGGPDPTEWADQALALRDAQADYDRVMAQPAVARQAEFAAIEAEVKGQDEPAEGQGVGPAGQPAARPSRRAKAAARSKISAQSQIEADKDETHKLLRKEEVEDEKKMKAAKHLAARQKKNKYDRTRPSYLVEDKAGVQAHLIEKMLVQYCGTADVLRLRATSQFHTKLIDESLAVFQALYSAQHPAFTFSFDEDEIDQVSRDAIAAQARSLGGIPGSRFNTTHGKRLAHLRVISGPWNPTAAHCTLDANASMIQSCLIENSGHYRARGCTLLTAEGITTWMSACEESADGLVSLESFALVRKDAQALKEIRHDDITYVSDHFRNQRFYSDQGPCEYPNLWLTPGTEHCDGPANMSALLNRVLGKDGTPGVAGGYHCSDGYYTRFSDAVSLQQVLTARIAATDTNFKGVLINVLLPDDDDFATPVFQADAAIQLEVREWTSHQVLATLGEVKETSFKVAKDKEIMQRHSRIFSADWTEARHQSYFQRWISMQQPLVGLSRYCASSHLPELPTISQIQTSDDMILGCCPGTGGGIVKLPSGEPLFENVELGNTLGITRLFSGHGLEKKQTKVIRYRYGKNHAETHGLVAGLTEDGRAFLMHGDGDPLDVSDLVPDPVIHACVYFDFVLLCTTTEVRRCVADWTEDDQAASEILYTGPEVRSIEMLPIHVYDADADFVPIYFLVGEDGALMSACPDAPDDDECSQAESNKLTRIKNLLGRKVSEDTPVKEFHRCQINSPIRNVAVSNRKNHEYVFAVTDSGDVWGWGSPTDGQLGVYSMASITLPRLVLARQGVVRCFASLIGASVAQTAAGRSL